MDQDRPEVVVRVGDPGDVGVVEISDIIFATRGPGTSTAIYAETQSLTECAAAGALVLQINVHEPENVQAGVGLWDAHIR